MNVDASPSQPMPPAEDEEAKEVVCVEVVQLQSSTAPPEQVQEAVRQLLVSRSLTTLVNGPLALQPCADDGVAAFLGAHVEALSFADCDEEAGKQLERLTFNVEFKASPCNVAFRPMAACAAHLTGIADEFVVVSCGFFIYCAE